MEAKIWGEVVKALLIAGFSHDEIEKKMKQIEKADPFDYEITEEGNIWLKLKRDRMRSPNERVDRIHFATQQPLRKSASFGRKPIKSFWGLCRGSKEEIIAFVKKKIDAGEI